MRSLRVLADGLWIDTEPVTIVGMRLATTMTVLALDRGELLVCSPVPLTAARREDVDRLGRVAHLYAPSTYHHVWIGEWSAAYPRARVHAPAGLVAKRPELRIDRRHGAEPLDEPLARVLDEIPIDGFRLEESVIVHRPSATLVVADLVHNVGRPEGAWTGLYTRAMGFWDRVAISRAIRWAGFSDRAAARRSVDRVLSLPFERLVVGHGAHVLEGARDALARGCDWLPAER